MVESGKDDESDMKNFIFNSQKTNTMTVEIETGRTHTIRSIGTHLILFPKRCPPAYRMNYSRFVSRPKTEGDRR